MSTLLREPYNIFRIIHTIIMGGGITCSYTKVPTFYVILWLFCDVHTGCKALTVMLPVDVTGTWNYGGLRA